MIKLIAFLGNYGKQYAKNRHNTAWLFAESLTDYSALTWQRKFNGLYAVQKNGDAFIYYLKPETYMNLSGNAVIELAHFYKIAAADILIVHDELELPLGTMSLKWSGGLGGHNGLRSVKAVLGTQDFWRLRFGIGRPCHNDISSYVLSDFTNNERLVLDKVFSSGEKLITALKTSEPTELLEKYKKVIVE